MEQVGEMYGFSISQEQHSVHRKGYVFIADHNLHVFRSLISMTNLFHSKGTAGGQFVSPYGVV